MAYEFEREYYKGPLEKLLELVEEKKLEITAISLADVTNDFFSYLSSLEAKFKDAPDGFIEKRELIADFLIVASRLVLIKSKVLMPSLKLREEEEVDIKNFENRLKLYKELKKAQSHIKTKWQDTPVFGTREFLMGSITAFYPPSNFSAETLLKCVRKTIGELEKMLKPIAFVKAEMVNLKEKIKEIFDRLTKGPQLFKDFGGGKSKEEIVVLFLAVLHLIKEQLISVDQRNHFDDIVVAKRDLNE